LNEKGLDVDLQNADGETALMRAVGLGQSEIVKALLAKNADRNRADVFGNTAVVFAYEKGNDELAKLLPITSFKAQPPNVRNAFLRAAIRRKDDSRVQESLAAGADPNHTYAIDYSHKDITRTVLILAAQVGHPRIVQLLLNAGADVKAQGLVSGSEHGLIYGTALEAAEAAKNSEVVAILKKATTAPAIKK
jgi:ankyrin repeat protein